MTGIGRLAEEGRGENLQMGGTKQEYMKEKKKVVW